MNNSKSQGIFITALKWVLGVILVIIGGFMSASFFFHITEVVTDFPFVFESYIWNGLAMIVGILIHLYGVKLVVDEPRKFKLNN